MIEEVSFIIEKSNRDARDNNTDYLADFSLVDTNYTGCLAILKAGDK